MFILKKLIGSLFMSMPMLAILLLLALILLLFSRRQVMAKVILTMTTIMFILIGYGVFSRPMLAWLESCYPSLDIESAAQAGITWVVVLAGGHVSDPLLPVTSQLEFETQARLIEGIRIARALPSARLLVSGGAVYDAQPSADLMAKLAQELGLPQGKIVIERESRDTKDEARIIKNMIGQEPFVLVTSGYHQPRSMALFQGQGMKPIAAPAGRLIHPRRYITPSMLFPSARNIMDTDIALHEFYGLVTAKIMGQL
jgi:uncharacterized SAM-binding protein YcdF (DUF218 family)